MLTELQKQQHADQLQHSYVFEGESDNLQKVGDSDLELDDQMLESMPNEEILDKINAMRRQIEVYNEQRLDVSSFEEQKVTY